MELPAPKCVAAARSFYKEKPLQKQACQVKSVFCLYPSPSSIQYVGVLKRGETVFTNKCWQRPQNDPAADPKGCLSSATAVAGVMFPTKKLEGQIVSDLPLSIPCLQNRPLCLTTFCEILQERTLNIARVTFPAQRAGLRYYFLHVLCIDTPF